MLYNDTVTFPAGVQLYLLNGPTLEGFMAKHT